MNKNIIVILLILFVPVIAYWALTKDKSMTALPSIAFSGPEIIKFSSPMCYECEELEKIFDDVFPQYANKVTLRKIDVTRKDRETKKLVRDYRIRLVPTCIFINNEGKITRITEGSMQPKILENYIKEQLNG